MKRLSLLLALIMLLTTTLCSVSASASAEEMYTVRYAYLGDAPADLKEVEAAANAYLAEKAGIQVELYPIAYGSYAQQINLLITGDEKLDLITELSTTFTSDVAMGKLLPLEELLNTYGEEAMTYLGQYVDACRVNGSVYAVPTIRDMGCSYGFVLLQDAVEAAGINVNAVKTPEAATEMLAALKANRENGAALVIPQTASMTIYNTLFVNYDQLDNSLGVLMDRGQGDMTVVNLFETAEYEANLRTIREWYQQGYILSDVVTNSDGATVLMAADKIVGITNNLKPGIANQAKQNFGGRDAVAVEVFPALRTTSNVQNVCMAIPVTCRDEAATMKLLNLLYTDPYLINLLDYGIEGTHYVKTDVENVIAYPEGLDGSNSPFCPFDGWQRGNQLLSYVFQGDEATLYEDMATFNDSAVVSKAFGFTFDGTAVKTELASLSNVLAQYRAALEDGTLDVDENLPKFQQALRDAGIEKVIAEKQAQLDAWVAQQN